MSGHPVQSHDPCGKSRFAKNLMGFIRECRGFTNAEGERDDSDQRSRRCENQRDVRSLSMRRFVGLSDEPFRQRYGACLFPRGKTRGMWSFFTYPFRGANPCPLSLQQASLPAAEFTNPKSLAVEKGPRGSSFEFVRSRNLHRAAIVFGHGKAFVLTEVSTGLCSFPA